MPSFWFPLKGSSKCKSEPLDVHDPSGYKSSLSNIQTRKSCRTGCSRSMSNLRDVIHGSKRHILKPPTCSPRSLRSSDFLNPITHEVIISDSTLQLKITGFGSNGASEASSTLVGTLKPGTPGPGDNDMVSQNSPRRSCSLSMKMYGGSPVYSGRIGVSSRPRFSLDADFYDSSPLVCKRCRHKFKNLDDHEAHHLSKHAVTELKEGDSSRKIVEIICKTSWIRSDRDNVFIDRVLKVHNMQVTQARFEEYREIVKIKASKLSTKHARCLADGNELLRFYGTTIACSLGMNASSSLCKLQKCGVCQILRHGFSRRELHGSTSVGIFTTSSSGKALESVEVNEENQFVEKALLLCRVIAGRVHKPLENVQKMAGQSGFDSLAGKVGQCSNIEQLYVLSPKALLPCFVIICKS